MTSGAQILVTPRLRLRNWMETDRDLFHEINADPKVMEFFPWRRTRPESDAMFDKMRAMISTDGIGLYALAMRDTDEPLGFCGLSPAVGIPTMAVGTVEIGWRLATRFWGNGYVTEAASALVDFGLGSGFLDEIVSFAVGANLRSIAVMERIGMIRDATRDFEHPRVPDSHPHLKTHRVYALSRSHWDARQPIPAG